MSDPFVNISLWRRHTQTVKNGASRHKTNYIEIFSDILNPEGHQNCCIGSKVTTILLNGWILPTGGASLGRVSTLHYYGRSRQCGRPIIARCSMGLGRSPLINGLIQHTLKLNFLFVEKFTAIPFD